ncbi:MAG: hypothetical protein WBL31_04770 [Ilumatobacteraceae bacterium]
MRSFAALVVLGAATASLATGCSSDGSVDISSAGTAAPRVLIELIDSAPGDVIALRAATGDGEAGGTTVEWIDRRAGTIRALTIPDEGARTPEDLVADVSTLATIDVSTEGEQRGLLGHTVIDGIRYAAWTDPDTNHLLVGEVGADTSSVRIVWDGGGTAGGAVGGHLEASDDGQLILGIGQLTDWAKANGSGAMVRLDPAGPSDQEPMISSDGYTNPFAFTVAGDQLWVADNAVGDDVERIGRGDLDERDQHTATGQAPRAPSAMIALDDGTLGVCGFLDGQLLAWRTDDAGYSSTLGPCLTGAATLPDGTIVTAAANPDGEGTALLLLPAP